MPLPDRERWRQLSPLLDELMELEPAACAARLVLLRARDAALGAELETLLRASGQADAARFLSGLAPLEDGAGPTLAGRRIGAYAIDSLLGQGASGSVWRARRADGRFDGEVAVKLLHLSLLRRAGALRFEREGAILARLTHPHIARLLDAGISPEGQPYLVLELVEGERIDTWCDARRLGVAQRLAVFDAVLDAVAHAHSQLVIHRDIKPGNILVRSDGGVKLLDFGIARLLHDGDGQTTLTAEGRIALTPQYAAPEQVRGEPVSTATDVYALGLLLFVLLTGRHPTSDDHSSPAQALRATLDDEPLRLSRALALDAAGAAQAARARATTPARLARELSGDLENIVGKALRKDPAARYATVREFADDLRRHLQHQPVLARPDSAAYRGAKFLRRHRGALAAAALLLLAVAAGAVGTLWQARRAEAQAARALAQADATRAERDRAQRALAVAESLHEFMGALLGSSWEQSPSAPQMLQTAERLVADQFGDDAALRARILLSLAELGAQLGQQAHVQQLLRQAEAAAASTSDPVLQALVQCQAATTLNSPGDEARRGALVDQAWQRLATAPEATDSDRADCLGGRAARALDAGDLAGAEQHARAALALLGPARPGRRSLLLTVRMNLAGSLFRQGRMREAMGSLREVLHELDGLGRGHTVLAATLHGNLAVLLAQAGDPLASLAELDTAGRRDPRTALAAPELWNRAQLLLRVGRLRESREQAEMARQVTAHNDDRRSAVFGAASMANCPALPRGLCEQRLAAVERSMAAFLPPHDAGFAILDAVRGQFAYEQRRYPQALAALQKSLATFDEAGPPQARAIRVRALLARAELALGNAEAAVAPAAAAVAQARALDTGLAHSSILGEALLAHGLVQQAQGDTPAARQSWHAALAELQPTLGPLAPETRELQRLLADP